MEDESAHRTIGGVISWESECTTGYGSIIKPKVL